MKQKEKSLSEIRISDFSKEFKGNVKQWKVSKQRVPEMLLRKIKGFPKEITIQEFLKKFREELYDLYGEKRDKAKSFADSRFTPINEMVDRGMVSCGALTNIFGTVLRELGVPVRFIHGGPLRKESGKESRHSWLEVYDPTNGKWVETDPIHPEFHMWPEAKKIKIYHDWGELKRDYNKRNF